MLHIVPKPIFDKLLRSFFGDNYITADLYNPQAMVKMDITNIQYPDSSFDVICCSHVLEHVQDDKQAMSEFYRILKKTDGLILLVPITADKTFENPSVSDSAERLKLYGQEDHLRRYGSDYTERLEEAGFKVTITEPSDFLSKKEISEMGITREAGEIYYCTK